MAAITLTQLFRYTSLRDQRAPDPEDQHRQREERGGAHPRLPTGCKIGSGFDLLGDMQARRAIEFELKGQVMKPMEVLLSATMVNTEIFRMADRIGSVEPGRHADLLIIEGNPLKNLRVFQNSTHLHAIVKAGVFVERTL